MPYVVTDDAWRRMNDKDREDCIRRIREWSERRIKKLQSIPLDSKTDTVVLKDGDKPSKKRRRTKEEVREDKIREGLALLEKKKKEC